MDKGRPRLRMLAGPNGSGKSSLVPRLSAMMNLGASVNADEIEAAMRAQGFLCFDQWELRLTAGELQAFARLPGSQRLAAGILPQLTLTDNTLFFGRVTIDSYLAAWIAELLRHYLLHYRRNLLFETVMSHQSKLEFLADARRLGYRTYLYFVATADVRINLERVAARVQKGGHPVAADKIVERYHRSLALLRPALALTDRAFIFDNSGAEAQLIAEITNGREVAYQMDAVPQWVDAVLS